MYLDIVTDKKVFNFILWSFIVLDWQSLIINEIDLRTRFVHFIQRNFLPNLDFTNVKKRELSLFRVFSCTKHFVSTQYYLNKFGWKVVYPLPAKLKLENLKSSKMKTAVFFWWGFKMCLSIEDFIFRSKK